MGDTVCLKSFYEAEVDVDHELGLLGNCAATIHKSKLIKGELVMLWSLMTFVGL